MSGYMREIDMSMNGGYWMRSELYTTQEIECDGKE